MTERLEDAVGRWRTFHAKSEPRELIDVPSPWPKRWGLAGDALVTYYASDKWEADGKINRYYHDHDKGVQVWEPWGTQPWLREGNPSVRKPRYGTVLGQSEGWELARVGDGKRLTAHCAARDVLCCSPAGDFLFVVDQRAGKVTALFVGSSLSVQARGIVG